MKRSADERVEQVLAGLRASAGPEGLEERVLRRVLRAEAEVARGRRLGAWAWGSVGVAALVLAGVVGVGGHVRQRAVMVAGGGVAHRDGSDGRGTQQAAVAGAGAVEGGRTHHGGREAGRGGRVSVAAVDGRGVELAAGSEEDRVAMEEMLAPSRPAPALPLTGQERLLMRIARNGDPVEKAALDAARREARSAQDVAEYEAYFALQVRPAATDATND